MHCMLAAGACCWCCVALPLYYVIQLIMNYVGQTATPYSKSNRADSVYSTRIIDHIRKQALLLLCSQKSCTLLFTSFVVVVRRSSSIAQSCMRITHHADKHSTSLLLLHCAQAATATAVVLHVLAEVQTASRRTELKFHRHQSPRAQPLDPSLGSLLQ
jgi:hypothetical protein